MSTQNRKYGTWRNPGKSWKCSSCGSVLAASLPSCDRMHHDDGTETPHAPVHRPLPAEEKVGQPA